MAIDVSALYPNDPTFAARALTVNAHTLQGSQILGIAAQVRALKAQGHKVCDLTVGDFAPAHFPTPEALRQKVTEALTAGHTNYPPSDGIPELRQAIVRFYEERLGLRFPVDSIYIASGARPPLYATYRCLLEEGDTLVYAVPSWNNDYYVHLNKAREVVLPTRAEDGFMPTLALIAPHLRDARVLHLNSPLNPCGTAISGPVLQEICEAVVAENRRRDATGERPLFLLYDMVYWPLTFGEVQHVNPISLVPEVAPYTILVDAISKWCSATGLRVGWGVVPVALQGAFKNLIGHIGAWAPRAEQVATTWYLGQTELMNTFTVEFKAKIQARLDLIHRRLTEMAAAGLPVRSIEPQGAIYLSGQLSLLGRTLPGVGVAQTNEDIRRFLLESAGVALVPFQAFGLKEDTGWFRFSVGAVGLEELAAAMDRLEAALRAVPTP
ncbi:aminotransferase class I/II-fold pyridoxal phosphate-dependent enzyme [Myxococcota bacterium]|nr:aminotransferase class I/II-fold pyridoxal phosphate-dependent enzyme [Myxococcota bacterium]